MTPTAAVYMAANAARWAARILGALMFLFLLAFFLGEGPPGISNLSAADLLALLGWAVLGAGFLIAWKWEAAGGLMILAVVLWKGRVPAVGLLYLWAGIGLTHVICAALLRHDRPPGETQAWWSAHKRKVMTVLWMAIGVFVLLAVNEMFGMPPLMTPRFNPPEAMAGTWHAEFEGGGFAFEIHQDGSVTGSIGDASIAGGRFTRNRTWFGQLMNWRTDYIIMGDLSSAVRVKATEGNRFTAPLNFAPGRFTGAVFLGGRDRSGARVAPKPVAGRIVLRRR